MFRRKCLSDITLKQTKLCSDTYTYVQTYYSDFVKANKGCVLVCQCCKSVFVRLCVCVFFVCVCVGECMSIITEIYRNTNL